MISSAGERRTGRWAVAVWVLVGCGSAESGAPGGPLDVGGREVADGEGALPSGVDAAISDGGAAPDDADTASGGCRMFSSSFEAIQALVFERQGCTAAACHGAAAVGGLDLRAGSSWRALVDVKASNSAKKLVAPGTPAASFLLDKMEAATRPGSVQVAGSPMPIGAPPLSEKELEAVKLWIAKGAPEDGVVADSLKGVDVGALLDACLPNPTPVKIKPLEPPAPAEGIQLRLPPYTLKGGTEIEHCVPFVYDFTDQVPAAYKDEARNVLYTNGSHIRQDPQSHHLVIWNPKQDLSALPENDPSWTCHGGASEGKTCNPRKASHDCGEGVCAGKAVPGTFCSADITSFTSGSGTPTLEALLGIFGVFAQTGGGLPGSIANTQTPQQIVQPIDGIYTEIPLRGVVWANSHAFNLTSADTLLEARVNFLFAKDRKREMRLKTDASQVGIAAGTPPFTRKTYCTKLAVPQNYQIARLASHTHRHGEHFWVKDGSGKQIYESFDYSDPLYKEFEPWLTYDQPDEAARTLEYCATFNNGLTKDDKPDLNLVTRASRMPASAKCTPVACVAGKVTTACKEDSDCDSGSGKGDGKCDACAITKGVTTEDEMFTLMPWYVFPAE